MTSHADPPPGYVSYEQVLRNEIAGPGVFCGPPIYDGPTFMQELFPFLTPARIRELEHQARQVRQVRRAERELEIG
jgi:hypothetical protein